MDSFRLGGLCGRALRVAEPAVPDAARVGPGGLARGGRDADGAGAFPGAATVGLFASKTFRLGARYLSLSGSVDNLFDDRRIVHSGYESMRLRKIGSGAGAGVEPFGSKYLYAYGRTCYLTLNFRF